MEVFCGIDWAEDHHDIALVDRDGQLLARRRISDDAAGLAALLGLLAEHGDSADDPIPVAIETPRGQLPSRKVYPIHPMAVARYRDRHSIAGRKSDHGDAVVLAGVLRTDRHAHRPLPADTELAQAIAVLARAQQDAVWARTGAHNKLRSHLREYFPGFLAAFADSRGGITRPEAHVILAAAPTPAAAGALTLTQLRRTAPRVNCRSQTPRSHEATVGRDKPRSLHDWRAISRPAPGIPAPHQHARPRLGCHGNGPGRPRAPLRVPAGRGRLEDPCRVTRPALVHSPRGPPGRRQPADPFCGPGTRARSPRTAAPRRDGRMSTRGPRWRADAPRSGPTGTGRCRLSGATRTSAGSSRTGVDLSELPPDPDAARLDAGGLKARHLTPPHAV